MDHTSIQATHRSRRIIPIVVGNAIQVTGVVLGLSLLWSSAQPNSAGPRTVAMIAGYLLIYFNSHSLMHYSIGRLVGIHFKHYSIGGSNHTASYPPIVRTIFQKLPFFAAHTRPVSMHVAQPIAKALMFAAGITGTVVFCTFAAFFAYQAGVPGGSALLIFNIIWQVSSLIAETRSTGDLGKAINILKNK